MNNSTLYINEKQVFENIELLRKNKKVCLMVKAENYGMGYEFINNFVKQGYNYFGVSTIEEAREVRKRAPQAEILIVAYVSPEYYQECIDSNYTVTVYSQATLDAIEFGCKYHLKFDTGMGRIGFSKKEIPIIKATYTNYHKPIGIYSHAPVAVDEEYTNKQIDIFKEIVLAFSDVDFEYIHFQNSVGSQLYEIDFTNMIRPGLGIWGYYSDLSEKNQVESILGETIKPALSLKAKVHMIKDYEGQIGYDLSEYVSGRVATLRIGYHDGFSRTFSGYKFENGSQIIGKICMCQCFLKVDEKFDQEYIEIFGENESIYKLVNYSNKIVYEFLATIARRIIKVVK